MTAVRVDGWPIGTIQEHELFPLEDTLLLLEELPLLHYLLYLWVNGEIIDWVSVTRVGWTVVDEPE